MHNPRIFRACSAYKQSNLPDFNNFLHKTVFSPVLSTWFKVVNAGYFITWPGLTSDLIRKYLPKSMSTAKGHLRQLRQNISSTKPKEPNPPIAKK